MPAHAGADLSAAPDTVEVELTASATSGEVQRWRIVNASAGRFYRLSLPGHTMLHVGSDGGLFKQPVEVEEILLATAERVELLVRGTGLPGDRAVLQSLPYDRYVPQTRPAGWDEPRQLLSLQYGTDPPIPPVLLPDVMRPVTRIEESEATATRLMVMTQGFINGQVFDMNRVDVRASLGHRTRPGWPEDPGTSSRNTSSGDQTSPRTSEPAPVVTLPGSSSTRCVTG